MMPINRLTVLERLLGAVGIVGSCLWCVRKALSFLANHCITNVRPNLLKTYDTSAATITVAKFADINVFRDFFIG
jgi:hypothetical protein